MFDIRRNIMLTNVSEDEAAQVCGYIKMVMGTCDNAALLIMRDCFDKIADVRSEADYKVTPCSPHPLYRHKAKALFRKALDEREAWRRRLLHPAAGELAFFDVRSLHLDEKYRHMTNEEYFDFWQDTGTTAYQRSQPLVMSLHHKIERSFIDEGIVRPAQSAWTVVGVTALQLAVYCWQGYMQQVYDELKGAVSRPVLDTVFAPFSLQRITTAWHAAVQAMYPNNNNRAISELHERNIEHGVRDLVQLWLSPELPYDGASAAMCNYADELFTSKRQMKKHLMDMEEMKREAVTGTK